MAGLTIIDTSVFIIDLRYKRDKNFAINRAFLEHIARDRFGATTIFNLLEVCGVLSFNLNEKQLQELFFHFARHYQVEVLPRPYFEGLLPTLKTGDLFEIISRKVSFGDALIMAAIEKHIPGPTCFVSWNAEHFAGRLSIPSMTPPEFLKKNP